MLYAGICSTVIHLNQKYNATRWDYLTYTNQYTVVHFWIKSLRACNSLTSVKRDYWSLSEISEAWLLTTVWDLEDRSGSEICEAWLLTAVGDLEDRSGSAVSSVGLASKVLTLTIWSQLLVISFLSFCRAHILWLDPVNKNTDSVGPTSSD
jgi:hypothetical protein